MRFVAIAAIWLSTILAASAASFKVVTWNTQWLPGGKPEASAEEQATQMAAAKAIVAKLDPDVLLLQEVADWKAAQELCSVVPGLHVAVTSDFQTRPQNLVIASKFPADSAWAASWEPVLGEDNPPRGYAFAALRLPGNVLLLAYTVHFKSNFREVDPFIPAREEAARQLLAHMKAMSAIYSKGQKTAVLVGGDFNTSVDGREFKKDNTIRMLRSSGLKWVFSMIAFRNRITIPGKREYPDECFDHMLYFGLTMKSVSVSDGQASSDHNPIVATFAM